MTLIEKGDEASFGEPRKIRLFIANSRFSIDNSLVQGVEANKENQSGDDSRRVSEINQ
jgi:hypothetical protein